MLAVGLVGGPPFKLLKALPDRIALWVFEGTPA